MKPSEENKWLDQIISEIADNDKPAPNFAKWCQDYPRAIQSLKSHGLQHSSADIKIMTTTHQIWRNIMKNRITKLATVATIILVVALFVTFLGKSVTPAYGFEQTVEACHLIRNLHTQWFDSSHEDVAKECWLEFDESGQIINARIHWAEWMGNENIVVWDRDRTQVWNKKHDFLKIFNDEIYTSRIIKMVEKENLRLSIEHLYEREATGEVEIEIDEPTNRAKPTILTVTKGPGTGKRVLFIDQATKLVIASEWYLPQENGGSKFYGRMEYYDHNIPIDAKMFSLDGVVSDKTKIIDTRTQDVGLAQGNLTDQEIATKVVCEFLEALITEDYTKASQIHVGFSPSEIQKRSEKEKVVRIVSIDKPVLPNKPSKIHPRRLYVPCTVEVKKNGRIIQQLREFRVTPVIGRRDRWASQGDKLLKQL